MGNKEMVKGFEYDVVIPSDPISKGTVRVRVRNVTEAESLER